MSEIAPNTGYTLVPAALLSDPNKFELNIETTKITWHEYPHSVNLNLQYKEPQILKVGDFITFGGRNGSGAMIIKFFGYADEIGPTGFTYLPWRDEPTRETGRWATPQYTIRGDARFIICYPCGIPHNGHHIMWNELELINHLAPILNPEFQKKLISLTSYPESE